MAKDKLIEALNKDLANLHIFWVKLHNYHWNIQGHTFFTLHAKTEEYYNYIGTTYDAVAERILQLGGKPLAAVKAYLDTAAIQDEEQNSFEPNELLDGCRKDFEVLREDGRNIIQLAEESKDIATANLYEDHVQQVGEFVWMLKQAAN